MSGRWGSRPHQWDDVTWHSPAGREIHITTEDNPHELTAQLEDGTKRHMHWAGPPVTAITVDGRRWPSPRNVDWDDRCATE